MLVCCWDKFKFISSSYVVFKSENNIYYISGIYYNINVLVYKFVKFNVVICEQFQILIITQITPYTMSHYVTRCLLISQSFQGWMHFHMRSQRFGIRTGMRNLMNWQFRVLGYSFLLWLSSPNQWVLIFEDKKMM